jgi:hypothetical protein
MVFTLQLRELDSPISQVSRTKLVDSFTDSSRLGVEPENTVKWYVEKYATREPFETTKAETQRPWPVM